MLWIMGLVVAYVLMAISNRLTGNPTAVLGIAFVVGCVWVLGSMVLRVVGMALA